VPCSKCGAQVLKTPSRIASFVHQFCSLKCRNAFHKGRYVGAKNVYWKGGASHWRGEDWSAVRLLVLKATPGCYVCRKLARHVHHIVPYRLSKDNSTENLVVLCPSHHMRIERLTVKIENTGATLDEIRKGAILTIESERAAHSPPPTWT
jgi:hypothetical protein